jgi:hypothetical protein
MQADPSQLTRTHTHTMFELGLTFSDQRHSTVAPCEKFLLEMVVPYTFDANFFISDTEEEDQGMVPKRRACSNCRCPAHSTSNMRRGPSGNRSLCNACRLWYSRHGTARPVVPQTLAPAAGKGVVSEIQTTYVVQAIAATDALSSRSHDRHDSAWWFAHGLALNAIKSS